MKINLYKLVWNQNHNLGSYFVPWLLHGNAAESTDYFEMLWPWMTDTTSYGYLDMGQTLLNYSTCHGLLDSVEKSSWSSKVHDCRNDVWYLKCEATLQIFCLICSWTETATLPWVTLHLQSCQSCRGAGNSPRSRW